MAEITIERMKELGAKMNAQNNRSTQLPLFVIQYEDKVICPDDFGEDVIVVDDEGQEVDQDELCDECKSALSDHGLMAHEIECEECGDHKVWSIRIEEKFDMHHGVFLTSEACDSYIKRRSYEMKKNARSYGISAYWSNDMGEALQFLSQLGSIDGKAVSQYQA